jgi:hypothetical protein
MARRPTYNVLLKDLSHDHEYYWTPKIRQTIANDLTHWFDNICNRSTTFRGSTVHCWWTSNVQLLDDDEMIIYFVPNPRRSLIRSVGKSDAAHAGGGTFMTDKGMISEVFISESAGDARIGRLLAVLAFHELMHNKLDAHPTKSVVQDIHNLGGAAKAKVGHGDEPTDNNKKLMAQHLGIRIPQYSGHLFSNAIGSVE